MPLVSNAIGAQSTFLPDLPSNTRGQPLEGEQQEINWSKGIPALASLPAFYVSPRTSNPTGWLSAEFWGEGGGYDIAKKQLASLASLSGTNFHSVSGNSAPSSSRRRPESGRKRPQSGRPTSGRPRPESGQHRPPTSQRPESGRRYNTYSRERPKSGRQRPDSCRSRPRTGRHAGKQRPESGRRRAGGGSLGNESDDASEGSDNQQHREHPPTQKVLARTKLRPISGHRRVVSKNDIKASSWAGPYPGPAVARDSPAVPNFFTAPLPDRLPTVVELQDAFTTGSESQSEERRGLQLKSRPEMPPNMHAPLVYSRLPRGTRGASADSSDGLLATSSSSGFGSSSGFAKRVKRKKNGKASESQEVGQDTTVVCGDVAITFKATSRKSVTATKVQHSPRGKGKEHVSDEGVSEITDNDMSSKRASLVTSHRDAAAMPGGINAARAAQGRHLSIKETANATARKPSKGPSKRNLSTGAPSADDSKPHRDGGRDNESSFISINEPQAPLATDSVVASLPAGTEHEEGTRSRAAEDEVVQSPFEMWGKSFAKFQEEGNIHLDDLGRALEFLGVAKPDECWIRDIHASISKYNLLNREEFFSFSEKYFEKQHEWIAEAFRSYDADESGYVDSEELESLLRELGIEPMRHVLAEVINEVDTDGQKMLDLSEFERVMDILIRREGFTRREYEEFCDIFRRFDRDASGECDAKELVTILNWLGYAMDLKQVEQVVAEVDIDGTGTINEREFIICMRKVRDREVAAAKKAIAANDTDNSGTVSTKELKDVMACLGYMCNPVSMRDAAVAAGLDPQDDDLDLSELWRLLTVYRQREGLSTENTSELEVAFKKYDKDGTGEISTVDVGKVLRWLGFPTAFENQMQLISRVDVDGSGKLDLVELRKIFRMLQDDEHVQMRIVFEQFEARDLLKRGTIALKEVTAAMHQLEFPGGHMPLPEIDAEDIVQRGKGEDRDRIPFDSFLKIAGRAQQVARLAFRESGGFTQAEVDEMRQQFKKFDTDGSGDIGSKELIIVIESVLPQMARDPSMRPKLIELLAEIDQDGNGTLDFQDFVRLMRQLHDLQDRDRANKEKKAQDETKLSNAEVSDFRELFIGSSNTEEGFLTLEELMDMLKEICPLGDKNATELTSIFRAITGKKVVNDGNKSTSGFRASSKPKVDDTPIVFTDKCDFPEFLWLMKKLLDDNFAHIRERTTALAASTSSS